MGIENGTGSNNVWRRARRLWTRGDSDAGRATDAAAGLSSPYGRSVLPPEGRGRRAVDLAAEAARASEVLAAAAATERVTDVAERAIRAEVACALTVAEAEDLMKRLARYYRTCLFMMGTIIAELALILVRNGHL